MSPNANGGDVSQSNDATTAAGAYNQNDTQQSVEQEQGADAKGSHPSGSKDGGNEDGCGCGGTSHADVDQSQTGDNSNDTTQDASANAETNQHNLNQPFSLLSHGSGGDVHQSNDATTVAGAGNVNLTDQAIGQVQEVG